MKMNISLLRFIRYIIIKKNNKNTNDSDRKHTNLDNKFLDQNLILNNSDFILNNTFSS